MLLGEDLDSKVQCYLRKVRDAVSAVAAARGPMTGVVILNRTCMGIFPTVENEEKGDNSSS